MYDVEICVVQTDDAKDLELPQYKTEGAAGMDLRAKITETIVLQPFKRIKIKTGLTVEIPKGYEIQIRPRSGIADDFGITVLNSPGTIDSDFRGEMKVILINFGSEPFTIERGDRIAQMVVCKVEKAKLKIKSTLSKTVRGDKEFGHTGVNSSKGSYPKIHIKDMKNILVVYESTEDIVFGYEGTEYLYNFEMQEITLIKDKDYFKSVCDTARTPFNRVFATFDKILEYRQAEKELIEGKRLSVNVSDYSINI